MIATDLSLDNFSDLQNSEIVHASRDLICFEELDVRLLPK